MDSGDLRLNTLITMMNLKQPGAAVRVEREAAHKHLNLNAHPYSTNFYDEASDELLKWLGESLFNNQGTMTEADQLGISEVDVQSVALDDFRTVLRMYARVCPLYNGVAL